MPKFEDRVATVVAELFKYHEESELDTSDKALLDDMQSEIDQMKDCCSDVKDLLEEIKSLINTNHEEDKEDRKDKEEERKKDENSDNSHTQQIKDALESLKDKWQDSKAKDLLDKLDEWQRHNTMKFLENLGNTLLDIYIDWNTPDFLNTLIEDMSNGKYGNDPIEGPGDSEFIKNLIKSLPSIIMNSLGHRKIIKEIDKLQKTFERNNPSALISDVAHSLHEAIADNADALGDKLDDISSRVSEADSGISDLQDQLGQMADAMSACCETIKDIDRNVDTTLTYLNDIRFDQLGDSAKIDEIWRATQEKGIDNILSSQLRRFP